MTKQEEIKEGIAEYVCGICMVQGEVTDSKCVHKIIPCLYARIKANDILSYLHPQGVVIKVECPDCNWSQFGDESVGMTPCHCCNSTGYITEPLIKEKSENSCH